MNGVAYIDRPQWTRNQLLEAYDMAEKGASLREIGPCVGHTAGAVDLMLWAVLCTDTVGQALEKINGQGRGGANNVLPLAQ